MKKQYILLMAKRNHFFYMEHCNLWWVLADCFHYLFQLFAIFHIYCSNSGSYFTSITRRQLCCLSMSYDAFPGTFDLFSAFCSQTILFSRQSGSSLFFLVRQPSFLVCHIILSYHFVSCTICVLTDSLAFLIKPCIMIITERFSQLLISGEIAVLRINCMNK